MLASSRDDVTISISSIYLVKNVLGGQKLVWILPAGVICSLKSKSAKERIEDRCSDTRDKVTHTKHFMETLKENGYPTLHRTLTQKKTKTEKHTESLTHAS